MHKRVGQKASGANNLAFGSGFHGAIVWTQGPLVLFVQDGPRWAAFVIPYYVSFSFLSRSLSLLSSSPIFGIPRWCVWIMDCKFSHMYMHVTVAIDV